MNVVIDSGNTYSKIGWFDQDKLVMYRTDLRYDAMIRAVRSHPVTRILYSSVSHSFDKFRQTLQPRVPVLHLTNELPLPVGVDYETPETLGVDRLAAAAGGNYLFPREDLVVIDAGTCITYDLIDRHGVFQGGIIAPGLRMRLKAMHTFTKRLPLIEIPEGGALIGKSTRGAMQSGAVNGMLAEIGGIVEAYRHQYPNCRVLVCGGDAGFFESRLKLPIFALPELVLIGLNRILLYNVTEIQ